MAGNITRLPASEHHFRETVIVAMSCVADQAHLRSGPGAGDALFGCPTGFEFELRPELFRTLVLERLRLPPHISEETCVCGAALDTLGRHRSVEDQGEGPRAHSGTRVSRSMNVPVSVNDERAIEVLASGLPLHAAGRRHHNPQCHHRSGAPVCKCRAHQWSCSDGSEARQRGKIQRARPVELSGRIQGTRSSASVAAFGTPRLAVEADVGSVLCASVCQFHGVQVVRPTGD